MGTWKFSRFLVSRLYDVLNEKQPVTTGMALRFAKLTGNTPESWARMQLAYDLRVNAAAMADQIAAIPTLQGRLSLT